MFFSFFFIDKNPIFIFIYLHKVSIERLTPDYLQSSKVNVTSFFPDGYVESPALFKVGTTYYATYGSCCCACRGGGGIVVFTAPA